MISRGALLALDCLVAAAVETMPQNIPPPSPAPGSCHVVGPAPSDAWAGQAAKLAAFSAGGWRFLTPADGLSVFVKATGLRGEFRGGAWEFGVLDADKVRIGGLQVLSTQSAAIASPSGGSTVDASARTAIDQILEALRHHGLIAS